MVTLSKLQQGPFGYITLDWLKDKRWKDLTTAEQEHVSKIDAELQKLWEHRREGL